MHKYETTQSSSPTTKTAIIGARGYSGLELARILLKHPHAELVCCFATDQNAFQLSDYLPEAKAKSIPTVPVSNLESSLQNIDVVFLATPAEVSMELAPKILKHGKKAIDLSGAFRLNADQYPEWYGFEHTQKDILKTAEYGLVPFCGPTTKNTKLVSNPGCYATAVMMAIVPLLKNGIIDADSLVIDAKSGTSGAGKKASESLLFNEVEGECLPYKVGKHQHLPEIQAYTKAFSKTSIDPHFSTSLLNVRRGIIAGIYAKMNPGKTEADVQKAYEQAFNGYPLVKFQAISKTKSPYTLSLKQVVGSGRAHIGFHVQGQKLYCHSLIDNLLKGAASQAIENFNRLLDYSPATGLENLEGVL